MKAEKGARHPGMLFALGWLLIIVMFSGGCGAPAAGSGSHWWVVTASSDNTAVEDFSQVNSPAFSPDGKSVAATSPQGWVRVWDIATGEQIAELSPKLWRWFNSEMYSPDGRFIVAASGQTGHPVHPGDTTSMK